jgi:hypothetical protein
MSNRQRAEGRGQGVKEKQNCDSATLREMKGHHQKGEHMEKGDSQKVIHRKSGEYAYNLSKA